MSAIELGLVHAPVMPFGRDHRIDFDLFANLIDFHQRHGADALALPMHAAESVSLPDAEKRAVVEFAVKHAKVPVIAHVSEAGSELAAALARHAERAGAAAVVATTPYYWTPPPAMVLEHFTLIGSAVKVPLFVHNAPDDMAGSKVTAELMAKLIGRLDNFAGLIDQSLDWQFMIELMTLARKPRPDFQLLAGNELMVSAAAIGATGMLAPLAGVAPKLTRRLYDACRAGKLFEARAAQEEVAALRQAMKPGGAPELKAALRHMGRDCGDPRPPLLALDAGAAKALADTLGRGLAAEPRGW
ncbi:MAG TPA: dihydrodipicolinate synthase family protein [Xanthobacteraceae bacterium]|jgi:4-hydroxy-tetrahydrodipicolinate synthase|nr:dihydrodipicolinate synthase family protein [Xanthobacteraceae bacterium]